jgi:hypothetical protein
MPQLCCLHVPRVLICTWRYDCPRHRLNLPCNQNIFVYWAIRIYTLRETAAAYWASEGSFSLFVHLFSDVIWTSCPALNDRLLWMLFSGDWINPWTSPNFGLLGRNFVGGYRSFGGERRLHFHVRGYFGVIMRTERSFQTGWIITSTFEPKAACSFETSISGDKDIPCQNPRGHNMKIHRYELENLRPQNCLTVRPLNGPGFDIGSAIHATGSLVKREHGKIWWQWRRWKWSNSYLSVTLHD